MLKKVSKIILLISILLYSACNYAKELFIPVVVKDTSAVYWQVLFKGAEDAAKKNGVKTSILGMPAETEVQGQISVLENTATNNPAAIIIAPVDKSALATSIDEIGEKLPVILVDSGAETEKYGTFVATDNEQGGRLAAQTMAKFFKEKFGAAEGKVAIIQGQIGAQSQDLRVAGFIKELKENYPKMEIITDPPKNGNSDLNTALSLMNDLIVATPDLRGVFTCAELSSVGVGQAIAEAQKQDSIVSIGFDNNPQTINFVKTGVLSAIMAQDPYKMGYLSMESALKIVNGEKIDKYIDTGVYPVTKDNIDTPKIKKILDPLNN